MITNKSRGIRNNNPLNLRVGNNWKGEVKHPSDPTFEQFEAMRWGVRAAFIVLRNYICRHKCNTIERIITRWAPRKENDTERYIDFVSKTINIGPKQTISFNDSATMISLFTAMCIFENGSTISPSDIIDGWMLANEPKM